MAARDRLVARQAGRGRRQRVLKSDGCLASAKTGSSVYVSVFCPDRAALAAARADVAARLSVLPPSS